MGEIKKIKKRFNLQAAFEDLEKRQKILNDTKGGINGLFASLNNNFDVMTMTLPEDKKDFVKKEIKAVQAKLEVNDRFDEKVNKIEEFVNNLNEFDKTLKNIDSWMKDAEKQLHEIKNNSDKMTPEDRVSYTMDLREDIADKVDVIKANIAAEKDLLPQGDTVPKDGQDYKDELERIRKYVEDLYARCAKECDNFSEDVKFWAQFRTGMKEFVPWLGAAESKSGEGLTKPQTLDEANAMFAAVEAFDAACLKNIKLLQDAADAANKMTTHKEADDEVAALKERYSKVKAISDEWMKKADTLVKEWKLLDNTVTELNSWVAKDRDEDGQQSFSLEKMESTLGELKNIFKEKEKLVENL